MRNLEVSIRVNCDDQGADWITLINEHYMKISGRDSEELAPIDEFSHEILVEVVKYLAKHAEIRNETT